MIRSACLAIATAFTLATSAAVAQETSTAPDEAAFASVVGRAVESYIVPAYDTLQGTTHDLVSEIEGFCLAPGAESRSALADAFARTVGAWAGVDFLRFGPMAREARYERFAFWPDVHGTGARQLRRFLAEEDDALTEPGALAKESAAVQGLPAFESLLYSGSKGLMQAQAPDAYRCRLAMAVAANTDLIAGEALDGWSGAESWASLMLQPGPDNPVYRTHDEAMTEILKAILTGFEQMREHRLHAAVGDTPEEAKASRAPYDRSDQALAYLRASAEALEEFVVASDILSLAPPDAKWIANSVTFEFSNLKNALEGAGDDLEAALADPEKRQKLAYAEIVLASLRDLFQRRFAPAVGLTQGFNSLDGD